MREVLRWGGAVGCFGFSLYLAKAGYESQQFHFMFLGVPVFGLGILIIWKPLFTIITHPIRLLVDSIFFPGGSLEKPVLNLKLPAYYIREKRYEEAREEYWKILKHYPKEVEPYEKLIWLAIEVFEDPREARKVLGRARRRNISLEQNYGRMIHG
jgi:tetratricopeptide (TPR) repeat protein